MSVSPPVLETRALVKRFGGLAAVDAVDFQIPAMGRLHAVIGPNGAGKTTLFNLVSGRLRPTSGTILFNGEDITRLKPYRIARLGIARTLQIKSVFNALSVYDNILTAAQAQLATRHFFRSATSFHETTETVERIIEEVGLQDIARRTAGTLSYGDVAMLELAIALAAEPRLLLLDEPICGMSPAETRRTVEKIVELSRRLSVILIEHDMEVVFDIADDITVMAAGRILAQGTRREIAEDPRVREAYLGYDDDDDNDGDDQAPAVVPMGAGTNG